MSGWLHMGQQSKGDILYTLFNGMSSVWLMDRKDLLRSLASDRPAANQKTSFSDFSRTTVLGMPDQILDMGPTAVSRNCFMDYMKQLSATTFKAESYHLFSHNCNNFSDTLVNFLTGKHVPDNILALPATIADTPLGAMFKEFMDSMILHENCSSIDALEDQAGKQDSHVNKNNRHFLASSSEVQQQPEVFRPIEVLDQSKHVSSCLTDQEKMLWTDIFQCLSVEHKSVYTRLEHLCLLGLLYRMSLLTVVISHEDKTMLVLREDVLSVLIADTSHLLAQLVLNCEAHSDVVKLEILKIAANCCSLQQGLVWLTSTREQKTGDHKFTYLGLTKELVINSLLCNHKELNQAAMFLAFYLRNLQLNDDDTIELSCALTECLRKEHSEEAGVFFGLSCLKEFMNKNHQVCGLVEMLGLNWDELNKKSAKVKKCCDQIAMLLEKVN